MCCNFDTIDQIWRFIVANWRVLVLAFVILVALWFFIKALESEDLL